MRAQETNIVRFLSQPDTQFIIPVYQRNYDWGEEQCKQLIRDIIEIGSNEKILSHFIGSIVYIHDDIYTTSGSRDLTIIDGQQRITTITLIWSILQKLSKNNNNNDKFSKEILKKYLTNEFIEDGKLKLQLTDKNNDILNNIILNDNYLKYEGFSQLIENYKFFQEKINPNNFDLIKKGLFKLTFVEISLERGKDDPQKIFQSLNSTGLDLTQGDLIRNYILMGLKPKYQQKIYNDYWMHIEKYTTDIKTSKRNLSDFIRDYLTIKNKKIPNKKKVFDTFESKYVFENKPDYLEKVLKDFSRYASYYYKLINPSKEENKKLSKQLSLLKKLEVNVSYPFFLEVYNDKEKEIINIDTFIKVLILIQSFVWRRVISGLPTNALNKIFMTLYRNIDKTNQDTYIKSLEKALITKRGPQKFPTNDEITNDLKYKDIYNMKSKNRNYFLERLENFNNTETVIIEGNDKITIEHIFPKNPSKKWEKDINKIDYVTIESEYIDTVSNLTLSGNNGSLGNKSFIEKRDMKEKGYKDSRLFLNRHLSKLDKWDLHNIEERYKIICERFKEIWYYPDLKLEDYEDNTVNISEDFDPTNKTIDYIIFKDEVSSIDSYKNLLDKICNEVYREEPEIFFNTDLEERLKISPNKDNITTPISLGKSYFIEGHGSSINIVNKIKYLLDVSNIYSDELFIKFKN